MLSRFSHGISDRRTEMRSNKWSHTAIFLGTHNEIDTQPTIQPTIQSAIKFFSLSSNKAKSKWSMNSRGTHERTSAVAFVFTLELRFVLALKCAQIVRSFNANAKLSTFSLSTTHKHQANQHIAREIIWFLCRHYTIISNNCCWFLVV